MLENSDFIKKEITRLYSNISNNFKIYCENIGLRIDIMSDIFNEKLIEIYDTYEELKEQNESLVDLWEQKMKVEISK